MRRTLAVLSALSLSVLALPAFSATRPKLGAASGPDADLRSARSDPASLFNRADANIQTSDTGGHIATVVDKQAFSKDTYGERATVQVEVTDPFGYYRGGARVAPKAILANVASAKLESGHDLNGATPQGTNLTLEQVRPGVYRGSATVEASNRAGDDMDVHLGKISVSFAGQKGTWNSRDGQNYPAPVTHNDTNINFGAAAR